MSSQAEVHSIDALKDFRTALALYSEDTLSVLGAVEAEVRRTGQWLQQERPYYWQEQIKRRREQVASAKAEVFRRRLQKTPEYSPSLSEPMEILRRAEASLQDAEKRLLQVRKWQPLFHQAVLEYHGSIQRIKDLAASDVPRALTALTRMIDALEAYLRVTPPPGLGLDWNWDWRRARRSRSRGQWRRRPNSRRSPSRSSTTSQPWQPRGKR